MPGNGPDTSYSTGHTLLAFYYLNPTEERGPVPPGSPTGFCRMQNRVHHQAADSGSHKLALELVLNVHGTCIHCAIKTAPSVFIFMEKQIIGEAAVLELLTYRSTLGFSSPAALKAKVDSLKSLRLWPLKCNWKTGLEDWPERLLFKHSYSV